MVRAPTAFDAEGAERADRAESAPGAFTALLATSEVKRGTASGRNGFSRSFPSIQPLASGVVTADATLSAWSARSAPSASKLLGAPYHLDSFGMTRWLAIVQALARDSFSGQRGERSRR